MMDRNGRIAMLVAAIVIAVAAFLVLRPGDEETEQTGSTATPAATTPVPTGAGAETPAADTTEEGPVEEEPLAPAIEVQDGEVVGGVQEIRAKQGETVEFSVASDTADEVHVHGYDEKRAVAAGKPAKVSFKADITGIFEVELENTHLHVANLRVEP